MTKSKLRQHYKKQRKNLSTNTINDWSDKIFNLFLSHFTDSLDHISLFLPIEQFKEVNTWPFLEKYHANFYLPVVDNNGLTHIQYESRQQLSLSDWGILEPTYGTKVNANLFDIVLVPLLAYDFKGNRVGYGKGFYDGFLKNCKSNCIFIGLSFFEPEEQLIETIPSDIQLNYCITPEKVYHFTN